MAGMHVIAKTGEAETYQEYFGIDISKEHIDVAHCSEKGGKQFKNTESGWKAVVRHYGQKRLLQSLIVLEPTGGYERGLLFYLSKQGIRVHRADTRKVKYFVRSLGIHAKTDSIDAKNLALYGQDRSDRLTIYIPPSKDLLALQELVNRRRDITKQLAQEKTRAQKPMVSSSIAKSMARVCQFLEEELAFIQQQIDALVAGNPILKQKQLILKSVPGIGKIMSDYLLAVLPELGQTTRRCIASLCGLAPHPRDSGKKVGYRSTAYSGRRDISEMLHLSALTAARSNSPLGHFYLRLVDSGKPKLVALTALKRKIIVLANARIRDLDRVC